jgi:TatD DNase family protein
MLIDSHCHLDSKEFDADRDAVIERALDAGVERMVAIGSEAGVQLAETYPFFYATVGIHPHEAAKAVEDDFKRLDELLAHPKVVAVGEIGLDYHYDFAPRDTQRAVFIRQMEIASGRKKPIVIHTREAWDDTFALLHLCPFGIMHCFSGGPIEAQRALEFGFHLSFGGIVTYPKALAVQEAARMAPLDRLLIETDAPYLAPVPRRGKRNEPAFVTYIARKLADLRGVTFEDIARATTKNARRLLLLD